MLREVIKMLPEPVPSDPAPQPPAEPARGMSMRIPSGPEWVRVVRLAVLGVASRMKFSYDDVEDIKLAVSEACNNAILHARAHAVGNGEPHEVEIEITPFPDRLEICVADGGRVPAPGIAAPRRPHVLTKDGAAAGDVVTDDLRESGLGLFLMQSLMDDVQHLTGEDHNTEVRLTKYVPRIPSSAPPREAPSA